MKELPSEGGGAFTIRDFCQAHRISLPFITKCDQKVGARKKCGLAAAFSLASRPPLLGDARETAAASRASSTNGSRNFAYRRQGEKKSPAWGRAKNTMRCAMTNHRSRPFDKRLGRFAVGRGCRRYLLRPGGASVVAR